MSAYPQIDFDEVLRLFAKQSGLPRRYLRTKSEVKIFRKRSAAAKLGWKKRRLK